jgi:hypothetical protein
MSLVNDALKKAQREAAAREAQVKGLPEPLASGPQPFRARRRRAPGAAAAALAALAATLVVVAGGGALFLFSRGEPEPPRQASGREAPEKGSVSPSPPAASAEPVGPASSRPRAAPTDVPEGAAAAAAPERTALAQGAGREPTGEAPAAPSPELLSNAAAPAPASISPPPSGAPASGSDAPPTARTAPAEPRTHVREVTLEDGRTIRLGGIAYSETAPLAYLNGRLLGVGEFVEGCPVRRIERGRVLLGCVGGELALALE